MRIARLAESITILKGLFADGPFSFGGEHYTITELDGQPKPVQRPHPPFVIGGGGTKVLALAGREADIVGINANLKGGKADDPATASDEPGAPPTRSCSGCARRPARASTTSRSRRSPGSRSSRTTTGRSPKAMAPAFETTPDEVLEAPVALVGTESQIVELLEARRERWQMSYTVVPHEAMDQFAPIVARLAGT